MSERTHDGIGKTLIASLLAVCAMGALAASASASTFQEGAGWQLTTRTYPTYLPPNSTGTVAIHVFNVGAAASKGTITITDTLPPGVTATDAGELVSLGNSGISPTIGHRRWKCIIGNGPGGATGASVTCTNDPEGLRSFDGGGGAPTAEESYNLQPIVAIAVKTGGEASALLNHATIVGGGAPAAASAQGPVTISAERPPFGFVGWDAWASNADGTLDTQAGSHPYEATFAFDLADALSANQNAMPAGGDARDIEVNLPPGWIGNPAAVSQCPRAQLDTERCPATSQIGVFTTYTARFGEIGLRVFNMVPPPGVPAEFGVNFQGILNLIDSTVHTDGAYGITTHANQVAQRAIIGGVFTIWGVPGEASHNLWREGRVGGCTPAEIEQAGPQPQDEEGPTCAAPHGLGLTPFLTLPTSCGAPQAFSIRANTWQDPSVTAEATFVSHDSNGSPIGYTGCEDLAFGPGLTISPDTANADAPAGLTAEVKPPLGGLEERGLLVSSDLKHATVTLPEGFVVNPGQAAGLQACQETPEQSGIGTENAASCPPASKIGTARIKSPLLETSLEKEIEGNVYVLQSNPPQLHLLLAASADGVNLKLVGIVHLNEATGQLTTTFGEDPAVEAEDPFLAGHLALPQLPFSDFKLSFDGGARAALDTPARCGAYATDAVFTPWSSPFLADFATSASFGITAGSGGVACPSGPLPFAPSLAAGSTSPEAGAFTGFTQLIQRGDGQQRIEKFQFKEPAGMAGMLSQVPLCPEPRASQGTCDEASKIGHAIVQSGPGNNPLTLPQPGGPEIPIYLTGPYHGAPFGLSIKTPVVAGPFNLGTIVTRAKIDVDPTTAQITIATDALPQILDGVPTDLRSIYAVIDRQGFLFNPTNCTPQEFVGTATSVGGAAVAAISSHFGIGACRALKFAPKFTASTSGKASKANGASLHVKIAYPNEPQGSEADIAKVNLTIPAVLPTRLTTIQKACTEAQFNSNPAGCPAASVIATAIVHTPVLKSPLTGPAYFVSHGGAAFPDVEMILQGEGVTLLVDGKTQIKKGVTFSRFETVPDAPFSSFEFNAPQGPFSIFAAFGNLCATEVKMATTLTAQNGAVLTQSTPVDVQGCPNGLRILSHSIRKRTITLKVIVPGAGKLTASGKGLTKSSKSSKGRSTLTLTIKAKKKHGRLRTKVKLSFAPTKGHKLAATVAARFKR